MKTFRLILGKLGLASYSDFTKSAFIRHNIRALKTICIIAGSSALLFFVLSFLHDFYVSTLIRVVSLLTILFTGLNYLILQKFKQNTNAYHSFHFLILLNTIWMSAFGIIISLYDCAHGGRFIVFLITQLWIFGILLIPPFVSIVLAGIDFTVFLILVYPMLEYPEINCIEAIFFYITLIIVNYFHYDDALRQTYEEEKVMIDNEYLAAAATTDSLTDARNRAGLRIDFSHYRSKDLYVMMMDIDRFKHFNDTYGHQTGDKVLESDAKALLEVFGESHVYRYGGDEFLVIKSMSAREDFEQQLSHARDIIARIDLDIPEQFTCSCGYVYGACESDEDLRAMIKQADAQLYQAKSTGRGLVVSKPFEKD